MYLKVFTVDFDIRNSMSFYLNLCVFYNYKHSNNMKQTTFQSLHLNALNTFEKQKITGGTQSTETSDSSSNIVPDLLDM